MRFFPVVAVCVAISLLVPGASHGEEPAQPVATLLVTADRIWTADPAKPWAEAVAIDGDRIVAVGSRAEVEPFVGPETVTLDLADAFVTPAWIDSHVHLFKGGLNLRSVQLRDAGTRQEFIDRIGAEAERRRPGEWITGGDWDHTLWGGELPTRDWIDSVTPDNPVWINRLDGHMALANSLALEQAGVDDSTATPDGGAIEKDSQGRPTGLLRDNAMGLVARAAPEASANQLLDALQAASDYFLGNGVGTVVQMGTLGHIQLLRAARARDELRVRVYAAAQLPTWKRMLEDLERNGRGDAWLRLGGLKGFVDGSLGSHTAAFLVPYTDAPEDRGLLVNTMEDLRAWTAAADAEGLQVMVHAIGDRAIRGQLDLFESVAVENGPRDRRFRIEHAQHIHPDDLPRFAELAVIPSMQPYHAIDDGRWATASIGDERSLTTYAFRSLIDTGSPPAFGSDWFVAPATPLEGIYAAVTRRTIDDARPDGWVPSQKITVEEALRAYTADAAYAMFAEDDLGMIAPGKLADLVVVDRDLTRIDPVEIRDCHVLYTILAGEVAYEKD